MSICEAFEYPIGVFKDLLEDLVEDLAMNSHFENNCLSDK